VVLGVWTLLAARLLHLQLATGRSLNELASRQRVLREMVPARPGEILDRHGRVFATSVVQQSLYVVPSRIDRGWQTAAALAGALGRDAQTLFELLAANAGKEFLWVKRRLSNEEADRVRKLNLPRDCWGFRDEFRRYYPQGSLAAHVIGLRDVDGEGRGGVEQSFQQTLRGRDGWRTLIVDARGRVIEVADSGDASVAHGHSITLAIDAVIQLHAEQALDQLMDQWKPLAACAVVMDPQTGEILAMASRPTFDPNLADQVPEEAWKNRTISDLHEPGSTIKPFIAAWALMQGAIEASDMFDCEMGEYRMGRRVLHDHHRYGRLSVEEILVKSSNIGMAKIGLRLGNQGLHQALRAFGFGARTGVELPGELAGIVRPLKTWNDYSTGSVPMGQEMAATPLQTITAYAALANGGMLVTPRIVHDAGSSDRPGSLIVSRAIPGEVAGWVRERPLVGVVARGTGRKAFLPGFRVFGKTGTAQKPDPKTGLYSRERHVSSFVCGAPADQPKALVLVLVDEPSVAHEGEHFGGSIAAPAAGVLLRKTLLHLGVAPQQQPAEAAALSEENDGALRE
jgi:cell division protein FtsI/penicillin-binding protein 2